jgi:ABC-2 type transport system permease protein
MIVATKPGTLAWFARHEMRLSWRDWMWLLTGGHTRHWRLAAFGIALIVLFMHAVAYAALRNLGNFTGAPDRRTLVVIGATLVLYASVMLSQALENVTRGFYARGDLDLILSSPASARRLFAVRIGAAAASIMGMSLILTAPVINVLAMMGGMRWLSAYAVVAAMAIASVAVAATLTTLLFAAIGAKRTRLVAQVIAAVIGASFVICVQFMAILSAGTMSRLALLKSDIIVKHAPPANSLIWLPANASAGDWRALAVVAIVAGVLLAGAIRFCAPRFMVLAQATIVIIEGHSHSARRRPAYRPRSPAQALRQKEWVLLRRDPWLISQSLMQLLYLLPPFLMLWQTVYRGSDGAKLVVPVLIVAAGQLAGGLAWLAVSGEDAPDLIGTAPIRSAQVWRAKTEAVAGVLVLAFAPLVAILALVDPLPGVAALIGIAAAAASATAIQFWFRGQAKRSQFRRRHVSSRIATFAEAFSSLTWAGAGAAAMLNPWVTIVPVVTALAIVAIAWSISPARR